jgi:IS605 OrfB family transposase
VIVKIYPTAFQKKKLNEFIDTSRYVYNKTVESIEKGHAANFQSLRDMLVTENTKKGYEDYTSRSQEIAALRTLKSQSPDAAQKQVLASLIAEKNKELRDHMKSFVSQKNPLIQPFELETPKDVRANAVQRVIDARKTAFTLLKQGVIKFFHMKFQKKSAPKQTVEFSKQNVSMDKGVVKILPDTFGKQSFFRISARNKKKHRNITIRNNVDVVRHNGEYYMHIPVQTVPETDKEVKVVCGVDPGIRTFATVHSDACCSTTITEYTHRREVLSRLNSKLDTLKRSRARKRRRKQHLRKIEKRKIDIVTNLHWDFINDLLKKNDVIFFGDIKSHDIVKNGCNKKLNRDFNDLKFYQLKQRLKYKASVYRKKLYFVPEPYTTKSCSKCGTLNHSVGSSEVFQCPCCGLKTGRDFNASKNIKMKGLLQNT